MCFLIVSLEIVIIKRKLKTVISTITPISTKRNTTTYEVENTGPAKGQTQKCGGVKPVNGIPTTPYLDNYFSDVNTYVNKRLKTCTDSSLQLRKV